MLLISRHPELRRRLRVSLNSHGWRLLECLRAAEVGELLLSREPDLILLDLSGYESVVAEPTHFIRAHANLPLIALVAANDERQKVAALGAGADDCFVPPFESSEMLACMRMVLERRERSLPRPEPDAFHAGALEVDFLAREVRVRGNPVHVTPTEYKLLCVLIESAGKMVTHERLLREVWGQAAVKHARRLRIHMKQLQRKFELEPPFALRLIAERAVGYRLWVPASSLATTR